MLTALLLVVMPVVAPPATVTDLAWLHGCWDLTQNGRHVIEQWSAPEGGTMIGMSRSVVDGVTKEFEFLMIREAKDGQLEYVARPSGQAMATFTATRASANEIVFENPQHDFPTRIIYRRNPDGSLLAAVEGDRGVRLGASSTRTPRRRAAADRRGPSGSGLGLPLSGVRSRQTRGQVLV